MKNNILKNLIVIGIFAIFIFGANNTFAYYNGYAPSTVDLSVPLVATPSTAGQYNSYAQQQPYTYVQPQQAQPVAQPAQQKVANTGSTQGTSVATANTTGTTGKYINYDANRVNPNTLGASAYGYNNPEVTNTPVDSNGVTALSLKGSGSFMPSSVFQWIMLVLLILAIIVVARMLGRKSAANNSHAATH